MLASLEQADLRAFLTSRRMDGIGNLSAARELSAVRGFLSFVGGEDARPPRLKGPRVKRGLPRPVSPDEAMALAPPSPAAPAPANSDAAKKAKIEAAMLRAQLRKLEKLESPDTEQQAELTRLQAQLANAEKTLAEILKDRLFDVPDANFTGPF